MRHIKQGDEPASFTRWKKRNPTANWRGFSGSDVYQELKSQLIEQQEKICCYCEIALKQSDVAHIEHVKDKHNHPRLVYQYLNLLASCQKNDCCGHKKGSGYFDGMVTPHQSDCHLRFTYSRNGRIIPRLENDECAENTIELLGLNCKRLVSLRKAIIERLEPSEIDLNYLQQSLDNCIEWHNGFYTVIEYMIEKKA